MVKIQKTSELAKLSIAALLIGNSIVAAQDVPANAEEPVPAPVAEPVVIAPAPVVVAIAEPAPAAKPVESLSTSVAGTKISLYGRLELNAAYEDGITKGLWSADAPQNANKDAQGRTTLSIARTRLGLNLEGPSKEDEPSLKGRFEADFAGAGGKDIEFNNFNGSSGFRVRQSWGSVTFKDIGLTLLFGQTDDVVTPLDPPSINPSSLNGAGNLGNRRPQIRATQVIGPIDIAVAATHDRLIDSDIEKNAPPSSPAVQGRLGLKLPATWASEKANLAVGVGGLYGKNEAANKDDEKREPRSPETYSFNADLSLPLIDILSLTGEFFMGQNLSRYGDGSLGQKLLTHDEDGVKSVGWWSALALKLPANLSAATGAGMESLDDDDRLAGKIKSNMFIFGNLAYNFTSAAKLTFEYLNLSTDYAKKADGSEVDSGHLNRFELNFRYDFK
jgi:hypothetical protein